MSGDSRVDRSLGTYDGLQVHRGGMSSLIRPFQMRARYFNARHYESNIGPDLHGEY